MSQTTVAIFNANIVQVTMSVNNGAAFQVRPTSAATGYYPGIPTTVPIFVDGPPTPGTFGIGRNRVGITPSGWSEPQCFSFDLPGDTRITSLQMYVFWEGRTDGACVAYFASSGELFLQCPGQLGS